MSDTSVRSVNPPLPYPPRGYAWFVVALLVLAALIAFVDRQVVAIVVDPMKRDLGASDASIGWLYGIFALFYALAAIPIATLADRRSRKAIIATGIFFWSLLTMACGLSRTFWQVFFARIGVGVGEATLTPATTSLISDYFPKDRIPLALSVYQTGAVMGSGIAFIVGGTVLEIVATADPLILPWIGELKPWQQTFVYVGAPGLLLALLMLVIREPVRRHAVLSAARPGEGATSVTLAQFYRNHWRALVPHHIGFLSLALMGYAFVFWTVSYFVRVHGVDAAEASKTFGWIFFLTGPLGPVLIAWYAGRLEARGRRDGNILAGMIGGILTLPFVAMIQFAPSATVAFVLYVPAMIFVNSPFGIAYGSLPVVTPAPLRARVAAVYLVVVSIGMMLGPPIAGAFNESVFPGDDGVRYSILTMTAVFGLTGCIALWMGRRAYANSHRELEAEEMRESVA